MIFKITIDNEGHVSMQDEHSDIFIHGNLSECLVQLTQQSGFGFTADFICDAAGKLIDIEQLSKDIKKIGALTKEITGTIKKINEK